MHGVMRAGVTFGLILFVSIIILFILMFIYQYIYKIRHPFHGKIETYDDVNAFTVHYDEFLFQDIDENDNLCNYTIVNTPTTYLSDNPNEDAIRIPIGIYKSSTTSKNPYSKEIYIPARVFIWEHKNVINKRLAIDKERKEEKVKK